jgi:hypothetical protein
MKKLQFEDGDVFEIFLTKRFSAYCRVIGRNQYSPLFELFEDKHKAALDLESIREIGMRRVKVIFINKFLFSSRPKKGRFVGNLPLSSKDKHHPPIFQGSPEWGWRVGSEKELERYAPGEISYEELLKRGCVDMTIFAAKSIIAFYLKKKPFVFEPNLRPLPAHLRAR